MTTAPYDENLILNTDTIIRRVNRRQHVVPDESSGGERISSKLFSPSSGQNGGMSVDLLALLDNANENAQVFVTTPEFTGSVMFKASAARNANMLIGYDPIHDTPGLQNNPYHGEVWGQPRPNKFSNAQKRALSEAAEWFVELAGVAI